ncbi:hypothetical protein NMK71_10520 [Weeksellaceae bacterium KMM 9713]|uniref:DUF3251 domain-containing protein n=1 Tax=Profundicola chukchiensis TaxID=2961959 RepID=A0A9X4N0Z1_9FLAO|nr:hypothetical protein [Profundicola chukchiensis]MDG4946850.1 hypothetical protein [Profundicola chukchiensis]
MKKNLLFFTVFLTSLLSAQSEGYNKLQSQIEANKTKIETLQSSVNAVTTENIYLKEVLDIQKPIKEASANNTNYKIVAVRANKEEKRIYVDLLIESTDMDKYYNIQLADMIDVLGNKYSFDRYVSKNVRGEQYLNIPLKITCVFRYIEEHPEFIKLLKINVDVGPIGASYNQIVKSSVQLRDLPVTWE